MAALVDIHSVVAGAWGRLGGNPRPCYRLLVERIAPATEDAMVILDACHPFLVSSTGRTGTQWLASLLNEVPRAYVVHEPIPDESYYHADAFAHPDHAEPYLRDFRIREMAYRIRARNPAVYGEVNGLLRRHIPALLRLVPQIRVIHLVRDGRDFVTSVMNRKTYTLQDKVYGSFQPPSDMVEPSRWQAMDRFSRICWMWARENAHIRDHAHHRARFEDITSRYDRFREQILEPLSLELDEAIWSAHMRTPLNATTVQRHPGYEGWTDRQKDIFWDLCAEEMAVHGYSP